MRGLLAVILALCIAGTAGAVNTGNFQIIPDKDTYVGDNMGDGREGGETAASAMVIGSLPFSDSGATCDNLDDITLPCAASAAADVFYVYTATATTLINVSMCGSGYDTALGIYDSALINLLCNDDSCGLQSEINNIPVTAGQTYYIVVDGFSTNCGSYVISVTGVVPCVVDCPAGALLEGEPLCGPDYYDTTNGGCNSTGFELICPQSGTTAVMCGQSGTYTYFGSSYRDTDWFRVTGTGGTLTATVNAEFAVQLILFYVIDYNCVNYQYNYTSGPCGQDVSLSYNIGNNVETWVWVGPSVFTGVTCGSEYLLTLTGIGNGPDCIPVPTEKTSWGAIKNLYNR